MNAQLIVGTYDTVKLKGTGSSNIQIMVNPDTLNFGSTIIKNVRATNLTIKNVGDNTLTLNLLIEGADKDVFRITGSSTINISKDETKTVTVEFYSFSGTQLSGSLKIDTLANVILKGKVLKTSLTLSPPSLEYGTVKVGESKKLVMLIRNDMDNEFTAVPTITGTDATAFKIDFSPKNPIQPSAMDSIGIIFQPTQAKNCIAVLNLDADKSVNAQLSGNGVIPNDLKIETGGFEICSVQAGKMKEMSLKITNMSQSTLTINLSYPLNDDNVFSTKYSPSAVFKPEKRIAL